MEVLKKTDLWFQTWHDEFAEFWPNNSKFWKFYLNGFFLPKVYKNWAKKYRGVIFHDTEQWCQIWINLDLVVSKMAWEIGWTFIRAFKSLKNCTMMGSFCPKHYNISARKFRRNYVSWHWKVMQMTRDLKNDRNMVNLHASGQKSENLHFDGLLLFKAYKD